MHVSPRFLLASSAALFLVVACGTPRAAVRIEQAAPQQSAAKDRTTPGHGVRSAPAPVSLLGEPDPNGARPERYDDPAVLDAIHSALGVNQSHYSVMVRRLHDGRGASLAANREFYAASLFKLALLYEAERQRTAGLLDFDRAVQVTGADLAQDLGTAGSLGLDASGMLPVRAAVTAMVTRSDNTAAVLMLRLLGPATVDRTLAGLGLQDTSVNTRDLPTTAADMARLMEAIIRGEGVDRAWREDMVGLLLRQETRHGIPRLLPPDVSTGNKTGTWPGATHDVAFVDAPGGLYVIAVLSDRGWDWDPIARVSRAVYDVLTRE